MKKKVFIYALIIIGTITLTSCSKDDNSNTRQRDLKFNIVVNNTSVNETKAVKTGWENGDKIFVFFSERSYCDEFATLTFDGSKWNGAVEGYSCLDPDDLNSGTMYAVYIPFGNAAPDWYGRFIGSSHMNPALDDIPIFTFYLKDVSGSTYSVETEGEIATLNGTLNMSLPNDFVYFYLCKSGEKYNQNEKYRLSVEGIKPIAIKEFNETEDFDQHEQDAGQAMWGYKYGDGIAFAGIMDDSWKTDTPVEHTFILFSDGEPAISKTFTKTLKGEIHPSIKLKDPSDPSNGWLQAVPAPTYTLMGDGKKWADWYLGSSDLNDDCYGYIFRWGDIVPGGSPTSYISDYAVNSNLTGDYALFDVARAYLGANWRMPSKSELETLYSSCTTELKSSGVVTSGSFNKKGLVFTSNFTPNNSILLRLDGDAIMTCFWSSTNEAKRDAYYAQLTSAGAYSVVCGSDTKKTPRAIRPIFIGE
ncbi:MAG: hypothetical protein IKW90_17505 [Lachnospiraceae bacterium]|nr:hypothetical protein [Lachnospiraceae bacterium]